MAEIIIRTVEEFDAVASQMRKYIRDGLEDKEKVVEVGYQKSEKGRFIVATVKDKPKPAPVVEDAPPADDQPAPSPPPQA